MFNTLWKVPGVWTRPRIHKIGCTLAFYKWYGVLSWGQLRLSQGGRDGKLSVICLWGKCDLEIKERPKKDNLELCIPASGLLKELREQGVKVAYATYSSTRGFRAGTSSTTGISVWKRNMVDQLRVTNRKKSSIRTPASLKRTSRTKVNSGSTLQCE